MGNSHSQSDDNILTPPPNYTTPKFPSLYDPTNEFASGDNAESVGGVYYLYYSTDIYRFCLYWTLILYTPMYLLCGLHGFFIHLITKRTINKVALLAPLVYLFFGMLLGVLSSAIVGYSLAAVYSVGLFRMSTWVPFLWSIVITLVTIIGSYSTIVDVL